MMMICRVVSHEQYDLELSRHRTAVATRKPRSQPLPDETRKLSKTQEKVLAWFYEGELLSSLRKEDLYQLEQSTVTQELQFRLRIEPLDASICLRELIDLGLMQEVSADESNRKDNSLALTDAGRSTAVRLRNMHPIRDFLTRNSIKIAIGVIVAVLGGAALHALTKADSSPSGRPVESFSSSHSNAATSDAD